MCGKVWLFAAHMTSGESVHILHTDPLAEPTAQAHKRRVSCSFQKHALQRLVLLPGSQAVKSHSEHELMRASYCFSPRVSGGTLPNWMSCRVDAYGTISTGLNTASSMRPVLQLSAGQVFWPGFVSKGKRAWGKQRDEGYLSWHAQSVVEQAVSCNRQFSVGSK